jgi:hybrid cluster-associated redox disulfide protein
MLTKDMTIQEVVVKYPDAVKVFIQHGMPCVGCMAARYENIEQGAAAHGIDVNKLMEDLNKSIGEAE